jgi:hypothetical protein
VVANLFGIRATDPAAMRKMRDPVGPVNHDWVLEAVRLAGSPSDTAKCGPVVCAWGTHGAYLNQDLTVLGWIEHVCRPMALGMTRDGHPKHPLYMPYESRLIRLSSRMSRSSISGRASPGRRHHAARPTHHLRLCST